MRYLSGSAIKTLLRKIRRSSNTFLFLDYDGTLTPIVSKHSLAVLHHSTAKILKKLIANDSYRVGIISGRKLKNVQSLVKLKDILYAGNHGLELQGPNFKYTHVKAVQFIKIAKTISKKLDPMTHWFRGSSVENKGVTLTYHYRLIDPKFERVMHNRFNRIVKPWVRAQKVKVTKAKMALEIRPNLNWNKGSAVRWILLHEDPESLPLFIGDDKTDEHAFRALNDRGITIRVGYDPDSSAQYYFKKQREVEKFLLTLSRIKNMN